MTARRGASTRSGAPWPWVYMRPHEVAWSIPAAAVAGRGYTITEERQSLVDGELGRCVRYLAVKADQPPLNAPLPGGQRLSDVVGTVG